MLSNIFRGATLYEWCKNKIIEHNLYIRQYGVDMPEVENWTWESAMKNIKEEK